VTKLESKLGRINRHLCVQRHTPGADKEGNWLPHLQARQESRAELAGRTPAEQLAWAPSRRRVNDGPTTQISIGPVKRFPGV